jgi:hypothetical protein
MARIGQALYVAACVLAALIAGYAGLLAASGERDTMLLAVFFIVAFGIWGLGRLVRRTLGGP